MPAIHHHHKSHANAALAGSSGVLQVYTEDARQLITVPLQFVVHAPRAIQHVKKLVLCHFYQAGDPESCPKGSRCKFVHIGLPADEIETLPRSEVHVNYAFRDLDDVIYPRFPSGMTIDVAAPDGDAIVDRMDLSYALQTNALNMAQQRHCAHFYYNRACHLGPECNFIHAIFLDPRASEGQRAPAPREIGRATPQTAAENVAALPSRVEGTTYSAPSVALRAVCSVDKLPPLCTRYRRDPYSGGLVCVKYDGLDIEPSHREDHHHHIDGGDGSRSSRRLPAPG